MVRRVATEEMTRVREDTWKDMRGSRMAGAGRMRMLGLYLKWRRVPYDSRGRRVTEEEWWAPGTVWTRGDLCVLGDGRGEGYRV